MACRKEDLPQPGSDEYERWTHEDKGPSIDIVCWVFTGLAFAFIVARLYVRGRILKHFHADDYWATLGWICACLCTSFVTVATALGNGRHCLFVSPRNQGLVILWTIIAWWFGVLCFSLPKLAVVSLLCRLLNPSRYHRWLLWGMAIFNIVNLFVVMMLIIFRCSPIQAQWDFSRTGTCMPSSVSTGYSLYTASFSAFVDLYLSIYPSIVLYKLKIPRKKKIYLSLALGLGCVSCVVAIYKTTRLPSGLSDKDVSYSSSDLTIWTVVEGCVIIMAATVPVLAPLLDVFRRWRGKRRGSSSDGIERDKPREQRVRRHSGVDSNEVSPGNTSASGENSQDIILNAWETLYGPVTGNHRYDYPDKDRAGEV